MITENVFYNYRFISAPKAQDNREFKHPGCNHWAIDKREGLDHPTVFSTHNLTCKFGLMQEVVNHYMGRRSIM